MLESAASYAGSWFHSEKKKIRKNSWVRLTEIVRFVALFLNGSNGLYVLWPLFFVRSLWSTLAESRLLVRSLINDLESVGHDPKSFSSALLVSLGPSYSDRSCRVFWRQTEKWPMFRRSHKPKSSFKKRWQQNRLNQTLPMATDWIQWNFFLQRPQVCFDFKVFSFVCVFWLNFRFRCETFAFKDGGMSYGQKTVRHIFKCKFGQHYHLRCGLLCWLNKKKSKCLKSFILACKESNVNESAQVR